MRRRIFLGAFLLAALALAGACSRFGAIKGPFDGDAVNPAFVQRVVDKVEDRLDLSEAQTAQCRAMVEKMLTTALAQRQESRDLDQRLAEVLRSGRLDRAELDRLLARKAELLRNALKSGEDEFAALHAGLNPVQRDKLARVVLEHGEGGHHPL